MGFLQKNPCPFGQSIAKIIISVVTDIFGNSNQRNKVPAKLEELTSQDCIDADPVGLTRIMRSGQNQSLIHAALDHAIKIERASDILIAKVLNVLVAQDLCISIRPLAAGIRTGPLICRRAAETASHFDLDIVIEFMAHVLCKAESPVLKKALFKANSNSKQFSGGIF